MSHLGSTRGLERRFDSSDTEAYKYATQQRSRDPNSNASSTARYNRSKSDDIDRLPRLNEYDDNFEQHNNSNNNSDDFHPYSKNNGHDNASYSRDYDSVSRYNRRHASEDADTIYRDPPNNDNFSRHKDRTDDTYSRQNSDIDNFAKHDRRFDGVRSAEVGASRLGGSLAELRGDHPRYPQYGYASSVVGVTGYSGPLKSQYYTLGADLHSRSAFPTATIPAPSQHGLLLTSDPSLIVEEKKSSRNICLCCAISLFVILLAVVIIALVLVFVVGGFGMGKDSKQGLFESSSSAFVQEFPPGMSRRMPPGHRELISGERLAGSIVNPSVKPHYCPLEVGSQTEFNTQPRIPGAHYFNPSEALVVNSIDQTRSLVHPRVFTRYFQSLNLPPSCSIVIYNRDSDDDGKNNKQLHGGPVPLSLATWAWWILKTYGFDRVSVLQGGLREWIANELPLSHDNSTEIMDDGEMDEAMEKGSDSKKSLTESSPTNRWAASWDPRSSISFEELKAIVDHQNKLPNKGKMITNSDANSDVENSIDAGDTAARVQILDVRSLSSRTRGNPRGRSRNQGNRQRLPTSIPGSNIALPPAFPPRIPGASHYPISAMLVRDKPWLFRSTSQIQRMLDDKGVSKDSPVVVYGANELEPSLVYFGLYQLGYRVRLFEGGWKQWVIRSLPPDSRPSFGARADQFGLLRRRRLRQRN